MKINKKSVIAVIISVITILTLSQGFNSYAAQKTTITGRVNFRSGPSIYYKSYYKIKKGRVVEYLGKKGDWVKIKYNSKTGYVHKNYISKLSSTSKSSSYKITSSNKVVSYAKRYLGKPYVWSTQGPNSFDCSGFTYYVYKKSSGKILPRTSSGQSRYGSYVRKSNLRAGDLIFFDTIGSNNGRVSHVGMYIGNHKFIHAASGQGRVVINNLNSSYYIKSYVTARRIL